MDSRNALHFAGEFYHRAVFTASGFHVPACAELLEHRPFNPSGLNPERLTLSCLIRRAIWGFLLFDALLLRLAQLLCYLTGQLPAALPVTGQQSDH